MVAEKEERTQHLILYRAGDDTGGLDLKERTEWRDEAGLPPSLACLFLWKAWLSLSQGVPAGVGEWVKRVSGKKAIEKTCLINWRWGGKEQKDTAVALLQSWGWDCGGWRSGESGEELQLSWLFYHSGVREDLKEEVNSSLKEIYENTHWGKLEMKNFGAPTRWNDLFELKDHGNPKLKNTDSSIFHRLLYIIEIIHKKICWWMKKSQAYEILLPNKKRKQLSYCYTYRIYLPFYVLYFTVSLLQ